MTAVVTESDLNWLNTELTKAWQANRDAYAGNQKAERVESVALQCLETGVMLLKNQGGSTISVLRLDRSMCDALSQLASEQSEEIQCLTDDVVKAIAEGLRRPQTMVERNTLAIQSIMDAFHSGDGSDALHSRGVRDLIVDRERGDRTQVWLVTDQARPAEEFEGALRRMRQDHFDPVIDNARKYILELHTKIVQLSEKHGTNIDYLVAQLSEEEKRSIRGRFCFDDGLMKQVFDKLVDLLHHSDPRWLIVDRVCKQICPEVWPR